MQNETNSVQIINMPSFFLFLFLTYFLVYFLGDQNCKGGGSGEQARGGRKMEEGLEAGGGGGKQKPQEQHVSDLPG